MFDSTEVSNDQLMTVVKEIEKLEEKRKAVSEDIKKAYSDAKDKGFVVEALRTVIRLYKQDTKNGTEFVGALDKYWSALSAIESTSNKSAKSPIFFRRNRTSFQMTVSFDFYSVFGHCLITKTDNKNV